MRLLTAGLPNMTSVAGIRRPCRPGAAGPATRRPRALREPSPGSGAASANLDGVRTARAVCRCDPKPREHPRACSAVARGLVAQVLLRRVARAAGSRRPRSCRQPAVSNLIPRKDQGHRQRDPRPASSRGCNAGRLARAVVRRSWSTPRRRTAYADNKGGSEQFVTSRCRLVTQR